MLPLLPHLLCLLIRLPLVSRKFGLELADTTQDAASSSVFECAKVQMPVDELDQTARHNPDLKFAFSVLYEALAACADVDALC